MRYYIADCHFWHAALNSQMDCRGFASVEELNEHMIRCWNARVRPCDEVVILGDLSWGMRKNRQNPGPAPGPSVSDPGQS